MAIEDKEKFWIFHLLLQKLKIKSLILMDSFLAYSFCFKCFDFFLFWKKLESSFGVKNYCTTYSLIANKPMFGWFRVNKSVLKSKAFDGKIPLNFRLKYFRLSLFLFLFSFFLFRFSFFVENLFRFTITNQ